MGLSLSSGATYIDLDVVDLNLCVLARLNDSRDGFDDKEHGHGGPDLEADVLSRRPVGNN